MKDRIKKIFSLEENGLTKVLFNIVCVGGIISDSRRRSISTTAGRNP